MGIKRVINREVELAKYRGDFFTHWIGLPVSLRITRLFLHFKFSENTATLVMWIVGMIGAFLVAFGDGFWVIGFGLVFFHYILDYVDGQLARERNTSSILGSVKDRWCHLTVQMSFYFSLGFGLYSETQSIYVLIPVYICMFWNVFRNLIANLPKLIYCNELSLYGKFESGLIYRNYKQTINENVDMKVEEKPVQEDNKNTSKPRWRFSIRATTTSFDFFVLSLFGASLFDYLARYLGLNTDMLMLAIYVFTAYYIFNFFDYSKQYLFSPCIYDEVSNFEKQIKPATQRDKDKE